MVVLCCFFKLISGLPERLVETVTFERLFYPIHNDIQKIRTYKLSKRISGVLAPN